MLNWLFGSSENVVLRTPEQITLFVLDHFDELTEQNIGDFEREVGRLCPLSDERGLLYALRVSKCVRTLTSFKTVASRWNVAFGMNTSPNRPPQGLFAGLGSPNHDKTALFLARTYTIRVDQLCRELVEKAEFRAANSKTASAKRKSLEVACNKIQEAFLDVSQFLPYERRDAWLEYLDAKIAEVPEPTPASMSQKEKKPTKKEACQGCGKSSRILSQIESGQWVCKTCLREIRG